MIRTPFLQNAHGIGVHARVVTADEQDAVDTDSGEAHCAHAHPVRLLKLFDPFICVKTKDSDSAVLLASG